MSNAVTGYDPALRFYATSYRQGGRTVYALDLSLAQVASLIPAPDPKIVQPGNRRMNPAHANGFAEYVRINPDWVAPALMLAAPPIFDFEPLGYTDAKESENQFGIIAFPRMSMTELHILDGQHRILGIHMAINKTAIELDRERSLLASARRNQAEDSVIANFKRNIQRLNVQRKRYDNDRVQIQIVVGDDGDARRQMFFDITDNMLGIPTSVKTGFDSRALINRVARLVVMHPLLVDRVDWERDRPGASNPHWLSAKHIADIVRTLAVGQDGKMTRRREDELSENELASKTIEFFDVLADAFPQLGRMRDGQMTAPELRQQSQLGSPVTIRILAAVFYDLRVKGMTVEDISRYFAGLNKFLSRPATREWVKLIDSGVYQVGALAPTSRRQDIKSVREHLVAWATEDKPID